MAEAPEGVVGTASVDTAAVGSPVGSGVDSAVDLAVDSAVDGGRLQSLRLLSSGKVRDNYAVGEDCLLMVTSDRLSAFDVVMKEPIPGKGKVLNTLALFWFERLADIVPNHLTGIAPETVVAADEVERVRGRAMVVRRLEPILVEAVVRGYLAGSAYKEYQAQGRVCGIGLPAGLQQAQKLPHPIFTPAAKAVMGEHDENISFEQMSAVTGMPLAERIRDISLALYHRAAEFAATRGIIIADTKFEFGLDEHRRLYLMDEVLTPDSSRFWPTAGYRVGSSPPSYDKQFVRDYLESVEGWNKRAPPPPLPAEVVAATAARYREALKVLTGSELDITQ